jgi:hypothetical protein
MNHVILENPDGNGFYVYFLSPMRAMNEVVLGHHYRARVSADGTELLGSRAFSKSCFVLTKSADATPDGAKTVGLTANHLLDPFPQETHVFASLQHSLPLYIVIPGDAEGRKSGSGDQFFVIEGTKISPVKLDP